MTFNEENIEEYNRIPGAIRISEQATISIEELIVKLALVEQVIDLQDSYICLNEMVGDSGDYMSAQFNTWAVQGLLRNLMDVQHALKCGLYGYEEARKH